MSEATSSQKIPVESHHNAKGVDELVIAGSPVGNIRETIDAENISERSTKYNTEGVRPDDPYNYFYEGKTEAQPEASAEAEPAQPEEDPTWTGTVLKATEAFATDINELSETDKRHDTEMDSLKETLAEKDQKIQELEDRLKTLEERLQNETGEQDKELAAEQPRRVRNQDGVTERLVKYADGTFSWEVVDVDTAETTETAESPETSAITETSDNPEGGSEEESTGSEKQPGKEVELHQGSPEEGTETDPESDTADPEEGSGDDKKPGKELELYKGEKAFTPEVAPELQLMLDQATDKYAELTAKHRKGYLGHFLKNSKHIVKIPGMKWLAEKINDYVDAPIIEARKMYEGVINQVQGSIHSQYETMMGEGQERDEAIKVAAGLFAIEHANKFEGKVVTERLSGDEKTNRFVNWWVRQEGIKGKIKKALIVGVTSAGVGLATAGLGAPVALGILLGGTSGAAIANHVTKRRAKAVDSEGVTLAERQSAEDRARAEAYGQQQRENGDFITSQGLTDIVEDRTTAEKVGNRARMKSAAAVGGAAGGLGADIGNFLSTPDVQAVERGVGESLTAKPTPEVGPQPSWSVPESFPIEAGDGMTQGIQNALESVGYDLSPSQYWDLHQHLTNQFGPDYIINRGVPSNNMFVDPNSSFAPGVADAIKSWGVANAGWSI